MSLPIKKINSSKASGLHAKKVWFEESTIHVQLVDGRKICVPLSFYPLLLDAPKRAREDFSLFKEGTAIHFNTLNKDVSIAALVHEEKPVSNLSKKKKTS